MDDKTYQEIRNASFKVQKEYQQIAAKRAAIFSEALKELKDKK
jgi:hypothetical protein